MNSCRHCRQPTLVAPYCTKICERTELFCRRIACGLDGDGVQRVAGFCYRIDRDQDDFADAIVVEKSGQWKETYTTQDFLGLWSLPWDVGSRARVAHFLEAYPIIAPHMPEDDAFLLQDIKRATLILQQESHMYPYANRAVWWVNDPPQVLKWLPSLEEATITSMLAKQTALCTVQVLDVFPSLVQPSPGSAAVLIRPAMLMPVYPAVASQLIGQLPRDASRRLFILHLCCAALVELAHIQQAYHFFQHGDLHLGNIFIDSKVPSPPLDEIGAPPFPLGCVVLADFGRSTLTYRTARRNNPDVLKTVTAWTGRDPLPATEDAYQLLTSAMGRGGGEGLLALIRPIVTADATLGLARDVWALRQ